MGLALDVLFSTVCILFVHEMVYYGGPKVNRRRNDSTGVIRPPSVKSQNHHVRFRRGPVNSTTARRFYRFFGQTQSISSPSRLHLVRKLRSPHMRRRMMPCDAISLPWSAAPTQGRLLLADLGRLELIDGLPGVAPAHHPG